jgi:ribosomal protein S18 acetylase RimI-like enzyme
MSATAAGAALHAPATLCYRAAMPIKASARSAPRVRLRHDPFADPARLERVRSGVDLHNVAATGESDYASLRLLLEGDDGEVLGGILGELWGTWLHVTHVWVAPRLRGRGWARKLVAGAEQMARERGGRGVHLESYGFQAPGMYRKLGYEEFGAIDDFPPGHRLHFFRKRLDAAATPRRARARTASPEPAATRRSRP